MDEQTEAHQAQTDRLTNAAMGLIGRVWLVVLIVAAGFIWQGVMSLLRMIF